MPYLGKAEYERVEIVTPTNDIVRKLNEISEKLSSLIDIINAYISLEEAKSQSMKHAHPTSNIMQLFPNNNRWRWIPISLPSVTVNPRTEYEFWERNANGWLYYVFIQSDNPDVIYGIDIYADGGIEMRVSPKMLNDWGLLDGSGYGMHLTRWDEENNVYVVEMAPGFQNGLGLPFRGRNRAFVYNPSNQIASISLYAWIIELS